MPTQTLTAKGKQGKIVDSPTYSNLGIDGSGQTFIGTSMGIILPTLVATYSYGLKGKPKDYIVTSEPGSTDDDFVTTGAGNDTISTGAGNDIIVAGDGNDTLNGGTGNDILIGGAGDDTFNPGLGSNYIDGGEGTDTYDMADAFGGGTEIVVDLSAGEVTVNGKVTDYLAGIENVQGNSQYNVIIGDGGANELWSGSGGAAIVGNGGDDTINLGSGKADKVYWADGDGSDTIVFFDAGDTTDRDILYIDFAGADLTYDDMIAGGYLSFGGDANSTLVYADLDGKDVGDGAVQVAEFVGYEYGEGTIALFSDNIVDGSFALVDFFA